MAIDILQADIAIGLHDETGQGTFQDVPSSRAGDSTVAVMPGHGAFFIAAAPWLMGTGVVAQVDEVKATCMLARQLSPAGKMEKGIRPCPCKAPLGLAEHSIAAQC